MRPQLIAALVAVILILGTAALFTVQNLSRVSALSLSLGFWGVQLQGPLPVPYLLWIAFGVGLLLGSIWALFERVSAGRKVREMQRRLAQAGLRG